MYLRRMLLRFGILTLIVGQTSLLRPSAQSNNCSTDGSAKQNQIKAKDDQESKIVIDTVEFHGENPPAEAQRSKLTEQIQQLPLSKSSGAPDHDWMDDAVEPIREELQEAGFFKVFVEPKPFLIRAAPDELHYALRFDIESGAQYRLGEVHFKNNEEASPTISESLLRKQLQLKSGDLFAVSKNREALDGIMKLYNSKGYIDMVPVPETQFADKDLRIDLTIKIDEGSPYRIARIEVLGVGARRAQDLQFPQSTGEIFNPTLWPKSFENNQSQIPGGASPYKIMQVSIRNVANHTVNLTLDFRPCAQAPEVSVLHSRDIDLESSVPVAGTPAQSTPSQRAKIEAPAPEPDSPKP